jgi:GH15 family glucan-1,4-alpha-glucosidase
MAPRGWRTFWLVEALTRGADADRSLLDEACRCFEQMLGYANQLGRTPRSWGCAVRRWGTPQAFLHMALISAAYNLDRRLGSEG